MTVVSVPHCAGAAARPAGSPRITFTWYDLLFMHWPIDAERLRPLIPAELDIDTFDGEAWLGLVPFSMRGIRHACLGSLRSASAFSECNVRTYVRCRDEPGVWFFSLDAYSRIAVAMARLFWHLNYRFAHIQSDRDVDVVRYRADRSNRILIQCTWRIGDELPPSEPHTLAHFLTERYALFTRSPRGVIYRGPIWHRPWRLREAELLELDDRLIEAAGLECPEYGPLVHAVNSIDAEAWALEGVQA